MSTDGQTLAAQQAQLAAAGAAKVYAEKISGASTENRRELARAIKALGPSDVLVVSHNLRIDQWRKDRSIPVRRRNPKFLYLV